MWISQNIGFFSLFFFFSINFHAKINSDFTEKKICTCKTINLKKKKHTFVFPGEIHNKPIRWLFERRQQQLYSLEMLMLPDVNVSMIWIWINESMFVTNVYIRTPSNANTKSAASALRLWFVAYAYVYIYIWERYTTRSASYMATNSQTFIPRHSYIHRQIGHTWGIERLLFGGVNESMCVWETYMSWRSSGSIEEWQRRQNVRNWSFGKFFMVFLRT